MLGSADLIAFVPTRDPEKARKFYKETLHLLCSPGYVPGRKITILHHIAHTTGLKTINAIHESHLGDRCPLHILAYAAKEANEFAPAGFGSAAGGDGQEDLHAGPDAGTASPSRISPSAPRSGSRKNRRRKCTGWSSTRRWAA